MPINYKLYASDWKAISQRIRFERANNHCEVCGIENYTIKPNGAKVVLTVAHLNHDITDNRDENLQAMCQGCHNKYDKEYRQANRAKTRRNKSRQLSLFGD